MQLSHALCLTLAAAACLTLPMLSSRAAEQPAAAPEAAPPALNFKMKTLAGQEVNLAEKYRGKVVLFVNVASRCGLTPQYETLQKLHEKYADQGLAIIGFPCNQFGGQEPGTSEEIAQFCKANYGVTFDMFEKIDVNGDTQAPLYRHLTTQATQPEPAGPIKWNFEKFLLSADGKTLQRFAPRTKPDSAEFITALTEALKARNAS